MTAETNPFNVGDMVVFTPDDRTVGWHQHSFERWGIFPGYLGTVTDISDGNYLVVDNKADAGMHWSQFRPSEEISEATRQQLSRAYQERQ